MVYMKTVYPHKCVENFFGKDCDFWLLLKSWNFEFWIIYIIRPKPDLGLYINLVFFKKHIIADAVTRGIVVLA